MLSVPAFMIVFTKPQHPSMAVGAWLLLQDRIGEGKTCWRFEAVRFLSREMGLSTGHIRRMIRAGDKTFWRCREGKLRLLTSVDLWARVRDESPVGYKQRLSVPRAAFKSRSALYPYLSQIGLSRGSKPCSKAFSAGLLGRSQRTVQRYRKRLRQEGVLTAHENFAQGRRHVLKMGVDLRPGEFVHKGRVCRRLPDIIELRDPDGELIDILVNPRTLPEVEDLKPRVYFRSPKEARAWEAEGLPIASEPVTRLGESSGDWANIYGSEYLPTISKRNVKGKSILRRKGAPSWHLFSRQQKKPKKSPHLAAQGLAR